MKNDSSREVSARPSERRAGPAGASGIFADRKRTMLIVAVIAALVVVAFVMWPRGEKTTAKPAAAETHEGEDHGEEEGSEVSLSPEALEAAKLEYEGVTEQLAIAPLRVTGTVEANQEQQQQVTPLVSGRIEAVNVSLGDTVRAGAVLATVSSPEVAEMHGKLREAQTRLAVAERNLDRVRKAENRAGVLTAKARLDEAEATLRRTRKLIELGAGAGKDLVAAETEYATAKAEFEFQSSIALTRELNEAEAEVQMARTEVEHLRQSLSALGDSSDSNESHVVARVTLRAPISGKVTGRFVNAGAGIAAGTPVFTIGNMATVWIIANVPESQVGLLRVGAPAEVRTTITGGDMISGRINYIDPMLDEQTRTARVRVEVPNPEERLKSGMFVEVGFQSGSADPATAAKELVVSSEAIQRVGERTVVFVVKDDEPGHFEVRDVQLGGEIDGHRRVLSGLEVGEKVVTKGSFILKTQLMKGEMGEHGH